jgi:D-sedoheptulose 7-phosphate isomerase
MQTDAIRELVTRSLLEGVELRMLLMQKCMDATIDAAYAIQKCLKRGGKVLIFGNGGSAADAQHIAAELVGRFCCDRAPLAAIALTTDTSAITAISNDYGFEQVFARQIRALGRAGDVAIAISTSGNSPNIIAGVKAAQELDLATIGLTGGTGGKLAPVVDIPVLIPSANVARIQECHITIGHLLCEIVETLMFSQDIAPDQSLKTILDFGQKKIDSRV